MRKMYTVICVVQYPLGWYARCINVHCKKFSMDLL